MSLLQNLVTFATVTNTNLYGETETDTGDCLRGSRRARMRPRCPQEGDSGNRNGTGIESETRTFQSTTRSLTELKEWLLALGVTHVAMESTGVYWKPVMNILEPGGFSIMVVNARHIKNVPGHKTDNKDSAWICKLLRAGLLKGSFVSGRDQRDLRDLTR